MERVLNRVVLLALCCTTFDAAGRAGEPPAAAPGHGTAAVTAAPEAQQAFDRAQELRRAGRYSEAIPLAERALALREEALGAAHLEVAACLDLLGDLHRLCADYTTAGPLLERALALREATLGPQHPEVAQSLHNLALLYAAQDAYHLAVPLSQRALAIREATLGPHHPRVAQSLHILANHYLDQGQYALAEPLYQRALAMREATLGPQHPDYSLSLNNLATLYTYQGRLTLAEPMHQRALAIREAALGPQHPEVAQALRTLAYNYTLQGKYTLAEPLYQRALTIHEVASPNHRGAMLRGLAELHYRRGDRESAAPFLERFHSLLDSLLWSESVGLSGARLDLWLRRYRRDEEVLYALVRAQPAVERLRRLALAVTLSRKLRSAEELTNISHSIYRSLSGEDRERFERLRALHARLARLTLLGPGEHEPAAHWQQFQALTEQAHALEAELSRRSAPLRSLRPLEDVVERVATRLPPEGVLIEFVNYMAYGEGFLIPPPGGVSSTPGEPHYLALLLFPNGSTQAVDLGPAQPIDQSVQAFHAALTRQAAHLPPARELYQRLFRPLLAHLGKARQLFLAPDGPLALVPFDALHDGRRYLIDSFDFVYLTSGRDLLPREGTAPAGSVVVIAAPDFQAPAAVAAPEPERRSVALESFYASQRDLSDKLVLRPLAGTLREAESIQRLYPHARLLLGKDATKASLLGLEAPGILHIATHGFFLEDDTAPPGTRGLGLVESLTPASPVATLDPLLRSGLVLAGAKAERRALQDSVVTGLEMAGMDLWGTQLVVLSACDTGRGEVLPGQGVHGLRRSLVVAGAETLVTSLWKVQDSTTAEMMTAYYQHLRAGEGRVSALRRAMRELRRSHPHPYFWAPFIAIGKDRPLRVP